MRTLIVLTFITFSVSHAHDGEHGPGTIKNGKLVGHDGITYLDAGGEISWAGKKLRRKVKENGQVIYQYTGAEQSEHGVADATEGYLELKAPGGEVLKTFSFDHAGERPNSLEIHSPNFASTVEIPRHSDFPLHWEATHPGSLIKIIVEVRTESGALKGRLTVSTADDGQFNVQAHLLTQLPSGRGRIAVKRIWLGGCHPFEKKDDMLGIRTASSVVAQAILME